MKTTVTLFKRTLLIGSSLAALSACQCLTQDNIPDAQAAYASPDQAVAALVSASRADDKEQLTQILGPQSEKLVYSGDPVADRAGQQKFIAAYDTYHRLDSESADKQVLVVGQEEWPMPIPLVHVSRGWAFDTDAGAQAILDRRIGRNELNVIETCREYVMAQREFADMTKEKSGKREFAQHITSRPGTHDGLYWPAAHGKAQSPLGPLMAAAQAQGYGKLAGHHAPYHGYYFRILKQQGPDAAGGAKEYVENGHMVGGFALLATPAVYGDSGVKSFIVNQNGIVYENDLGPDTASVAMRIDSYNPDGDWTPVR